MKKKSRKARNYRKQNACRNCKSSNFKEKKRHGYELYGEDYSETITETWLECSLDNKEVCSTNVCDEWN